MHSNDHGQEATGPSWNLVLQELRRAVPSLVDDFMRRVRKIPAYESGPVDDKDLRDTAEQSISLVVEAIADSSTASLLLQYAGELGERRAKQGIPAEALTSAVRLNFPLIWAKITGTAGGDLGPLLATRVEEVWSVLDDYAAACYSSYISERMREARHEVRVRQEFIAALFSPEGRLPEVQERFARVFQTPVNSAYGIIAVSGRASKAMRDAGKARFRYLHESAAYTYLFWPVAERKTGYPYGLPPELSHQACGLAFSVNGLNGLEAASRQAAALASHLTVEDCGPLTFDDHWPRMARQQVMAMGFDVGATLHEGLQSARPGEAERIRETVENYLRTGSVADTADQLFAHRNTVLNRLRRFEELTSIDLRVPVEAARVVVEWMH